MGSAHSSIDGCDSKAYQIISVDPSSPGERCGLKATVDFVLQINHTDVSGVKGGDILNIVKVIM